MKYCSFCLGLSCAALMGALSALRLTRTSVLSAELPRLRINKFACANFRLLYSYLIEGIFPLAALLSSSSRSLTESCSAAPILG